MPRIEPMPPPQRPRRGWSIQQAMIAVAAVAGVFGVYRALGPAAGLFLTASLCLAMVAWFTCWQRPGRGAAGFVITAVSIPWVGVAQARIWLGDGWIDSLVALVFLYPTLMACGVAWHGGLRHRPRRSIRADMILLGLLGMLTISVGGVLFMLHGFLAAGIAEH